MEKTIQNIKKDKANIPVMFQKMKDFETEDTRFTKVKIWICHTGLNHNWSDMSKRVIEEAIPTLANTPILGYIEPNSNDEEDFSDHRRKLDKESLSMKYSGKAVGVIGESNNAKFEMRLCDDGIEREYLTVEGLLNKLEDSIDIMNRDIVKSQSMELHEDSTDMLMIIIYLCSLRWFMVVHPRIDHQPAMESSTIELIGKDRMQYTAESYKDEMRQIKEEINSKLDEFNKHFSIDERRVKQT